MSCQVDRDQLRRGDHMVVQGNALTMISEFIACIYILGSYCIVQEFFVLFCLQSLITLGSDLFQGNHFEP